MRHRRDEILRHVTRQSRGIEVGAWFSPLAPKREGYDCLTLDVFDGPTLRERAKADPTIPAERIPDIQDPDLIGSSTEIEALVAQRGELGRFDYIVSSHNFEHLPDPIKFLRGCGAVLRPGGVLSMAIPDRRSCFDRYRPNTRLSEWLQAWFEARSQPTLAQQFDLASVMTLQHRGRTTLAATRQLREAYADWLAQRELADRPYRDVHCWAFTPTAFELLITDARFLGLVPFEPAQISPTHGGEFFVHLRNSGYAAPGDADAAAFYRQRQTLLERLEREPADPDSWFQRVKKAWRSRALMR